MLPPTRSSANLSTALCSLGIRPLNACSAIQPTKQSVSSILILVPAECRHEELMIIEHVKAGKQVQQIETLRRRKDGTYVDVSLTISLSKTPGSL